MIKAICARSSKFAQMDLQECGTSERSFAADAK